VVANLSYKRILPSDATCFPSRPSEEPLYDQEELNGVVPGDIRKPFDMKEVIARIVDGSQFTEFKKEWEGGKSLVCGWGERIYLNLL
jgi:acyl-CoA carboxylase subunit beta